MFKVTGYAKAVKVDPEGEERNRQIFEKYGEPVSVAFWADETSMEEVEMLEKEEKGAWQEMSKKQYTVRCPHCNHRNEQYRKEC